jgi:type I restriction enzyme S subunit
VELLKQHKKRLMQQLFPREGESVPRLRFPEFWGEWRLGTIAEVFLQNEKPEKATHFDSDKILTVKLHVNGVVRNDRTSTLIGGANYFIRRAGQFIFSKIDLLNGAFGIIPDELDGFFSSSDVPAFSFNFDYSPIFFVNWFASNYRQLVIEQTGTALKRVSPEKLMALPIPLPSLPEQQRIADCLSSLDDLIAAQARKVELLKQHKKGLMQQMFPALNDVEG